MNEANDRADIIINTARKSCDRILADFRKKIQEERAILSALNSAIVEFKERLFKVYNNHISLVENIELLDEEEIIKYALSDESYTTAVIQNIKQDILNMTESASDGPSDITSGGFVEADSEDKETVARSSNVKDTIKELNKRILEQSDDVEIQKETDSGKINAEQSTENEYNEVLKQLGVSSPVDIEKGDEKKTPESSKEEFLKVYKTPENYEDTIKRNNKS